MNRRSRCDDIGGKRDQPESLSRRKLIVGGAVAGTALLLGGRRALAAGRTEQEIRIGWISPQSGRLAMLADQDPYVPKLARSALADGLAVGGGRYRVKFIERDSQSSPARASQLASELIDQAHVHLMLAQPTPDTVNPVADACEAAGVPCIGTATPLESFFFGRGGKLGAPSPFKWSFDFFPDAQLWVRSYLSTWGNLKTNRKVGVLYPNDADGSAFRHSFPPILEQHGYKVVDPGPYLDGTTDYSSQIELFRREECEIFNTVGLPDDVNTFWRQAAQLHYAQQVVIAQFAKAGQTPAQVIPLGPLGYNLTTAIFWTPVFPYRSPLTGMTSQQLAAGYEQFTRHLWNGQVGPSMALAEVGIAALKNARDPTNRDAIRLAIASLQMTTTIGPVDFKTGPYPNTATSPIIGVQWIKSAPGARFPLDCVTIEHVNDTDVPIQRKLAPYRT